MLNIKSPRTNCCVYGCNSSLKNVDKPFLTAFYKFPKNSVDDNGRNLFRAWIDAVKLPRRFSYQMKVCYRHFNDEDFTVEEGSRLLKPGVVPSKELPRCWKNKFYPRDYGRLVKLFEVRGIGRLRMCFEAKLARRLKKSFSMKRKLRNSRKDNEKQSDKSAIKTSTEKPPELPSKQNTSEEPTPFPFSSELDIKEEPMSDLEGADDELGKGDSATLFRSTGDKSLKNQQNTGSSDTDLSRQASGPTDRVSEQQWGSTNTGVYQRGNPAELCCQICMIGFSNSELLEQHNRALHAKPLPRPHTCILCSETFRMKSALIEHVVRHAIINSFQCRVCSKYFQTKYDLDDHFKGHRIMAKFYSCRECQKLLKTRAACWDHLNLHLRSRLNPAEGLKCDSCDRVCSTPKALKEHSLLHRKETDDKPYECKLCDRKILDKSAFLLHVRGHTLGLPHRCLTCGMSFGKKSELTIHSTTEHQERNEYECTICGVQFKNENKFIKHAISHDACLENLS